ncbi:hypothetical protein LCGC14_0665490 [marine sediment metagenome]|uniref:Uncharacterized protein n=1 Tax=marine sediment metagenome TaxID=412755 RepID=A0A0F9U0L9_9ZZZZ
MVSMSLPHPVHDACRDNRRKWAEYNCTGEEPPSLRLVSVLNPPAVAMSVCPGYGPTKLATRQGVI